MVMKIDKMEDCMRKEMKFRKTRIEFGKNEEAVSPVIGVILMVAITVILAAVIAAFVFGMAPTRASPQASIRASQVENQTQSSVDIVLQHQGGADLILNNVKIIVEQGTNRSSWDTAGNATERFRGGDTMRIYPTGYSNITVNGIGMWNGTFTGPVLSGLGFMPQSGISATISIVDIPTGQLVTSATINT
jgi:flagellin-like protein